MLPFCYGFVLFLLFFYISQKHEAENVRF
jgi:hypothetical protein